MLEKREFIFPRDDAPDRLSIPSGQPCNHIHKPYTHIHNKSKEEENRRQKNGVIECGSVYLSVYLYDSQYLRVEKHQIVKKGNQRTI